MRLADIMGDIMTPRKVERLRRELASLRGRRWSIRSAELVSLAQQLGRKRVKRGKEPTYEKPGWLPLTIPGHSGTLAIGTVSNILDLLEDDLDRLAEELDDEEGAADETEE